MAFLLVLTAPAPRCPCIGLHWTQSTSLSLSPGGVLCTKGDNSVWGGRFSMGRLRCPVGSRPATAAWMPFLTWQGVVAASPLPHPKHSNTSLPSRWRLLATLLKLYGWKLIQYSLPWCLVWDKWLFLKSAEELKLCFYEWIFKRDQQLHRLLRLFSPSAVTAGVISQAHSHQSFSPTCLGCLTRCLCALHRNQH